MKTARTSQSIRVVTTAYLILTTGLWFRVLCDRRVAIVAALLSVIAAFCYLLTPVSYELARKALTIRTHVGKKEFRPIIRCSRVTGKIPFSIKLFANGGLFAGTGFFWNRAYGIFRAYVTSSRPGDLVLLETPTRKVVISPENPAAFEDLFKAGGN